MARTIKQIYPDSALRLDTSRISPLSRAAAAGYLHIVRLLLEHGADPNKPKECAPEGRALWEACSANHIEIAKLLLDKGSNPNAGFDSCECCLTVAEVNHGDQAKPLQDSLRSYGAYWPPYRMDKEQLKQAIRDNSPAIRHDEFLRCVMQNCDTELLELLLNFDISVLERLATGDEVTQVKDPALLRILIERGLDPTMCNYRSKYSRKYFKKKAMNF